MRTTVTIQDSLLEEAKDLAHERKCTLGKIIEEALQISFSRQNKTNSVAHSPIVTFKGKGPLAGVNIDSNADLIDSMEEK